MKFVPLVILLLAYGTVNAQQKLTLSAADSRMTIHGSSTINQWLCRVGDLSGSLSIKDPGSVSGIEELIISVRAVSIRSIKENGEFFDKGMDANVHKALRADRFPEIRFSFLSLQSTKIAGGAVYLEARGRLQITDVEREISITIKATSTKSGILFEGKIPVRMTDFDVEPPTALFGTIRTANEIEIDCKVMFKR